VLAGLCNNQRPRFDIAWLRVTNHLYDGFPTLTVKQSHSSRKIVKQFNSESRGINITCRIKPRSRKSPEKR